MATPTYNYPLNYGGTGAYAATGVPGVTPEGVRDWSRYTAFDSIQNHTMYKDYIPMLYSRNLLEAEHDNLLFTRLVNREYEGELKQYGDTITIRKEPVIKAQDYVHGAPITYPDYSVTDSVQFTVKRAKVVPFRINDIDKMMSDLPDWTARWSALGGIALAQTKEIEFFEDFATFPDEHNCGATAGLRSASYNLGKTGTPVKVVAAGADTTAGEQNVVDIISQAAAAMAEQPGGFKGTPWMVIPPVMAQKIQTSELRAANFSGDSKTLLRSGLESIGNLCGFDIYQSNLLYKKDGEWIIPFGDNSAITYVDQITLSEVKDDPYVIGQKNHHSLSIYDWFPIHPEHCGMMVVNF
jgi:hypothetical protein